MSNTLGTAFKLTTYGESHGQLIGGIIDGCPAGLVLDETFINSQLARRRPGQSTITTQRNEEDVVQLFSGIHENITTGTPIGFQILNKDANSSDYTQMKNTYRPGHADYTYDQKFGLRDYKGGGRSSARETANWVAAGAIAQTFLELHNVKITAYVSAVGKVQMPDYYLNTDQNTVDASIVRCPDLDYHPQMLNEIEEARAEGDSIGGIISCVAKGLPTGLGEPIFNKLHAALGKVMLGINACKGFEIGSGFFSAKMRGSIHNDSFVNVNREIATLTNHSGGIQGGISNGQPITFRVAFKPVSTIAKPQQTITSMGEPTILSAKGRHDPCVVPRAVPIVEALCALVLVDFFLLNRLSRV